MQNPSHIASWQVHRPWPKQPKAWAPGATHPEVTLGEINGPKEQRASQISSQMWKIIFLCVDEECGRLKRVWGAHWKVRALKQQPHSKNGAVNDRLLISSVCYLFCLCALLLRWSMTWTHFFKGKRELKIDFASKLTFLVLREKRQKNTKIPL